MHRVREQVETFVTYGGYQEGMSVGEILDGSRADRLIKKELEKHSSGIIMDLFKGKSANKLVTLPDVNWQTEKYNIRGTEAVKVANQIEKSFRILL